MKPTRQKQPGLRRCTGLAPLLIALIPAAAFAVQSGPTAKIDFVRDIRPILADNCFACHGPDAARREGGFRFDIRGSAFGEADSGEHPLVAGDVDASAMLRRMRSADPDERMPPPDAKKQPTPAQIDLIEQWIRDGAAWQEHWAFIPPVRPEPPAVRQADRVRNPIDQFVLARLESLGKSPAPQASRETLARRLSLDLTGLPPTPETVDRFLADTAPDAYERLVDRLLDSPAYGEHMATSWLDAARFADTNGYQNDFRRSMWLWRDWVIRAFNDNMPYDQFTIEQIAGDMLPDATVQQKVATGFNRNHRTNTEGGSLEEEWLVENVVDRVETTSTVFLGLTMGCARCHDHKFDPITQREFYAFFAYFHNVAEKGVYTETRGNVAPLIQVMTPEIGEQIAAKEKELAAAQQTLTQLDGELAEKQLAWETEVVQRPSAPVEKGAVRILDRGEPPQPARLADNLVAAARSHAIASATFGPALSFVEKDHKPLDLGDLFDFDASAGFAVSAWVKPLKNGAIISRMDGGASYRGFDMLIMEDGRLNVHLIHDWPGNATKITTTERIPAGQWTHVSVSCTAPGKAADIRVAFNGRVVEQTVDSDSLSGSTLTDHPVWLGLRDQTPPFAGSISGLQILDHPLDEATAHENYLRGLAYAISSSASGRTALQQADIVYHFRLGQPDYDMAVNVLNALQNRLSELRQQVPTTMVMEERAEPRETYVLRRGQYDQPDLSQRVTAAVPGLFHSETTPANRLELARWLVDGNNPLTARVAVNHFWADHFGIGLLETPENFGVQSPPPSHPELLDWLATEFVGSGWNVKQMQRLIVTSATYRQSSSASGEAFAADPQNRLLARGPRFRLPAESIRDNALAISGLLTQRIGGPSVMPYQPDGLWEELAGGAREPAYQTAADDNLYRRSLYIYRKRTVPHPTMTTFDGTGRDVCTVARSRTNTPLQALALLNDMTYVEAARNLAMLALDSSGSEIEQIRLAFRRATARWPGDGEQAVLANALMRYQQQFAAEPENARQLIGNGLAPPDPKYDAQRLAAMTAVSSIILNLDEVITRE